MHNSLFLLLTISIHQKQTRERPLKAVKRIWKNFGINSRDQLEISSRSVWDQVLNNEDKFTNYDFEIMNLIPQRARPAFLYALCTKARKEVEGSLVTRRDPTSSKARS